ncbi:2-amino-4-hydroxy-6-hydroxymethyldihydropteridine diphosphokinase [Agitococcus lubricus]|uniref:2-amino-4-hydroxy-6-hydroxymethyldihydropteridine pyrophosphokinase n=1 Tax=Agitococcus lubricus TaxID=1077255 RepID=A0A2T5IVD4_9GAMM|nr:2-amino-4-hydroxy-6-hydroxymethyldihydropteridine diphosphokinase [Agitococcus lubricus]PTQ87840.1 2-amino-4-hydroxy-6-hydroxymethyldihydropteridine diphosphokinase [Agitococcus lubricus]
MSTEIYLGLGANLGQPLAQLQFAVQALQALSHCKLLAVSRLYGSKPVGPANQPDYLNAAVRMQTQWDAETLLDNLQDIEQAAGRVRLERWGARTLDIDILLYGNQEIHSPRLTIPHVELCQRHFVVLPLLDLCPELTLPNGIKVASLATAQFNDDIHLQAHKPWW